MSSSRRKKSSIPASHPLSRVNENHELRQSSLAVEESNVVQESSSQIAVPGDSFRPGSIEYMRYRLSIISNTVPAPKSKLTWINVSHTYQEANWSLFPFPTKKLVTRKVLKDLSGELRGGTLTAVLGPTEGGKTTLLKLLSGVKINGNSTGQVLISPPRDEKVSISFASRDDQLIENLKVRELLLYASRISNRVDNLNNVSALIDSLKLKHVQEHRVSNLSYKNKQIVRVATRIITRPDILVLDEITSGLDENSAIIIINKLKEFTMEDNSIVIVSFTSPSYEIINQNFQKMLCLSSLGNCIYFGSPDDLQLCFHDISLGNSRLDPIDFLLEIACGTHGNHIIERMVSRTNESTVLMGESSGHLYPEVARYQPVTSFCEQFMFLTHRQLISTFSSKTLSVQALIYFIFALFTGIIMNDGSCPSLEKTSNLIITFIQLSNIILGLQFQSELKQMALEVERDHWFSITCYLICKLFIDLFLAIILVITFWFTYYLLVVNEIGTYILVWSYDFSFLIFLSLTYSSLSSLIVLLIPVSQVMISLPIVTLFHVISISSSSSLTKSYTNNLKLLSNCSRKPYFDHRSLAYLSIIILSARLAIFIILSANRQNVTQSVQCCTTLLSHIYGRVYHQLYIFFNPNSDERLRYDVTQRDARII